MRFEVPQFIEIEDKIIGPLTWKQFIYLAGGVGILIVLYLIKIPFIFFAIIGIPLAALSASLAFHEVNNRPFSIFLESCVNYFTRSKLYLWKKEAMQEIIEKTEVEPSRAESLAYTDKQSLKSLSRKLELHLPE